eukprot:7899854-Pyramimonas_sp.AAC.1
MRMGMRMRLWMRMRTLVTETKDDDKDEDEVEDEDASYRDGEVGGHRARTTDGFASSDSSPTLPMASIGGNFAIA